MSNQKIPFGRGKSGTLDDLKAPKKKHHIENISRKTIKEGGALDPTKNTVGSEKLINDDFKRIKNGEAERVSIREGKSTEFHIGSGKNKRIYGVGCTGTVFPKEGKDLYCLSKTEARELSNTPKQDRDRWIQNYLAQETARRSAKADQRDRKELAQETARCSAKADQRNPKELAQETARRSAEAGKTKRGIYNDVNRAHPNYVNNNREDAIKIAHDAHQAHNKNKTPSEKGKGEDKGKNTQGHNQKEEVGNKVKGNNSNSSNSSPSSSKNAKSSASQGDTNKNAGSKPPPQPNRGRGH